MRPSLPYLLLRATWRLGCPSISQLQPQQRLSRFTVRGRQGVTMESLDSVGNILRHKNRHDLANLLARAVLDFEFVDIGFLVENADADVEIVDAAIFSPYTDCERLRTLPPEDRELMLECLREIWPYRGGFSGMVIRDVIFRVDPNAAEDEANDLFRSLTGWPRVDRTLDEIRTRLRVASNEEQFQAVGVLCREAMISLAGAVFEPDRHPPLSADDVAASNTDARRMLDRYVEAEARGKSNATIRRYVKVALQFANEVQHQRTATYRSAALCAEATAGLVNIIAILDGRRDVEQMPSPPDEAPENAMVGS